MITDCLIQQNRRFREYQKKLNKEYEEYSKRLNREYKEYFSDSKKRNKGDYMKIDLSKLICYSNKHEAKIGEKYYFFDDLNNFVKEMQDRRPEKDCESYGFCSVGTLKSVNKDDYDMEEQFIMEGGSYFAYSFIYPFYNNVVRKMDYKKLKKIWLRKPYKLYMLDDNIGMLSNFNDSTECCILGLRILNSDEISRLKDKNGKDL